MLEEQDKRILRHLQADGRATNQQLADEVGMSTSACWRRVRALEEDGVIKGYGALVDQEKSGFATTAIVHVSLDRHDDTYVGELEAWVKARPEILDCFATTGDADYHMRVVVRDMAGYNALLEEFMFRLPSVQHIRTNIILREIKSTVALPF